MSKMLIGFIMNGKAGGIDKYLLNFFESVHSEEAQIDFLTNEIDPDLQNMLSAYHSKLYEIANLKHPISQYRQVREILHTGEYDAVYLNISTAIDCVAAIAAKHERVKRIMIHSHSTGNDCENVVKRKIFDFIHGICRCFLFRYATEYYGPSREAGLWMFPGEIVDSDKFEIIYNAVDRNKFCYREEIREEVRGELEVHGEFVIGHIGNFCYQKNQPFLLQVFAEILRREPKAVLFLVGDGHSFVPMKELAKKLKISSNVKFLGRRGDVDRLCQAMDVFVLPSNFEGLGIVAIEAQSSGVPCVMSSTVPRECEITKRCTFLDLRESAKHWADVILRQRNIRKPAEFLSSASHYDLSIQEKRLKALFKGESVSKFDL